MIDDKTVAVVVPAYNEENQIGHVIESMPEFVDRIIVVNDRSKDGTGEKVKALIPETGRTSSLPSENKVKKTGRYNRALDIIEELNEKEKAYFPPHRIINANADKDRLILINLENNSGVGAAIAIGYKWCKDHQIDCTAVMAGDGQMDPDELFSICEPVIRKKIDYVKGNRLIHRSASIAIPRTRFFGNSILSILTKIASGYWHVSDTQTGYTAISLNALNAIRLYKIYPRYGMPNDMLVKLNIAFCSLKEVEIKPVYHVGEKSKMNVPKIILPISWLLLKSFFKRLWIKYLFRDFHPLFILYNLGFLLMFISLPFLINILINALSAGSQTPAQYLLIFIFLAISGLQSLLFAMWMDIQDNERLYK